LLEKRAILASQTLPASLSRGEQLRDIALLLSQHIAYRTLLAASL
jgi:hypothetical protein